MPATVDVLLTGSPLPAYAHPGDAGADLCAAEAVVLEPGERATIGTGCAIALPDGFAAFVVPRSGLASKHGITIVNSPEEADTVQVRDPSRVVWLSQTTLSVDETMETVRRLRERFPELQDPPSDDICYATQNRQVAIKKVAQGADLVIVVGSANSSNSVRLVEVALEYGAKAAYRVDYADEIRQEWLDGVASVGVTSGASVPEVLVQQVLEDLAAAGYRDVEEVRTAEEDLMFSLPKELRQSTSEHRGGRVRA